MPIDYPNLNDKYGEWWRGGDNQTSSDYIIKNRPAIRVVVVLTNAAKSLRFPAAQADEPVANWAALRKLYGKNVLRGGSTVTLDITNFITSMSWGVADDANYMDVNIELDNFDQAFSGIPQGAQIIVQRRKPIWSAKGKFYPMFFCYVWERTKTVEGQSQRLSLTCHDRMFWIKNFDVKHMVYKKDRAHKQGWTAGQIIRDMCRRAGVPVGSINISSTKIDRFEAKGGLTENITKVLAKEKKKSGRKTKPILHMRDNKFNIIIPRDPAKTIKQTKLIPLFYDTHSIEGGTVTERAKEKFATQLILKSSKADSKKNSKRKKRKKVTAKEVVINPTDPNIQKVFGIIKKTDTKLRKRDLSLGKLRTAGRAELDRAMRPDSEIEFSTRGYPNLWPGDIIAVNSGRLGIKGFYKIYNISYTLSNGQLLMTIHLKGDGKINAKWSQFKFVNNYYRTIY